MSQRISPSSVFEFMISDIERTPSEPVFKEIGEVKMKKEEWEKYKKQKLLNK